MRNIALRNKRYVTYTVESITKALYKELKKKNPFAKAST
jgi:hypothetical protein